MSPSTTRLLPVSEIRLIQTLIQKSNINFVMFTIVSFHIYNMNGLVDRAS